jgi:hypothetical protein
LFGKVEECSRLWSETTNGTNIPICQWAQQVIGHVWLNAIILMLIQHPASDKAIVDNKAKVTKEQLLVFLNICWIKYVKAKIEPG